MYVCVICVLVQAFAFDDVAIELARDLIACNAYEEYSPNELTFLCTPLQHSEVRHTPTHRCHVCSASHHSALHHTAPYSNPPYAHHTTLNHSVFTCVARAPTRTCVSTDPHILCPTQDIEDHDKGVRLVEFAKTKLGADHPLVAALEQSVVDHRDVIVKFGRYPHRNDKLGRESTREELEWLASPDLPGFAKSQK